MNSPLLVILARVGELSESDAYAAALRDTFVGPQTAGAAFVPRELLQAGEFREFVINPTSAPPKALRRLISSAERTLTIALDTRASTAPAKNTLTDVEKTLVGLLPVG